MKKLILPALLASLISGQSFAEYQVMYNQNQIGGDNIKFVSNAKWIPATPFISGWGNDGSPSGCSNWSPLENTVAYGVSFQQTATNCQQNQKRTIQNREQNDISHAYRDVGVAIVEKQTLNGQSSSRTSVGSLINWVPASPTVTEWTNSGAPTGCTNWTPDASTVDVNVTFTQNATDCNQLQTRTVQNREQNEVTQEFRNVGVATTENKTLSNQPNSRPATGSKTLNECSYVYGSTTVMSAWIDNDSNNSIEIWWKGTKIISTTSSVQTYTTGGFKYQRTGAYMRRDQMNSTNWYRYYQICRSPI